MDTVVELVAKLKREDRERRHAQRSRAASHARRQAALIDAYRGR